jgi:hypothetical protein
MREDCAVCALLTRSQARYPHPAFKGPVQQNVMFPPDAVRPGERAGQGNRRRTGAGKCASIGTACQGARPSHCLIVTQHWAHLCGEAKICKPNLSTLRKAQGAWVLGPSAQTLPPQPKPDRLRSRGHKRHRKECRFCVRGIALQRSIHGAQFLRRQPGQGRANLAQGAHEITKSRTLAALLSCGWVVGSLSTYR